MVRRTGFTRVITYYPFGAARNGEVQHRPRLVTRTLKQALSSVNLALGMSRRTTFFGSQFLGAKEPKRAIEHLEIARRGNPQSAEAHFLLGHCYDKQGKTLESMDAWDRAVEFNRTGTVASHASGRLTAVGSDRQLEDFIVNPRGPFASLKSANLIEEFQIAGKVPALDARGRPHYGEVLRRQGHSALKIVDRDLLGL